jgi:hypothetical protein
MPISGHGFQYEVEDRLKTSSWETYPEQSYLDDVELKPREVDIVAIKPFRNYNPRGNQLALVIECKYLKNDIHCFVRPNPKDEKAYFVDGFSKEVLFRDKSKFHYFRPDTVAVSIEEKTGKKDLLGGIWQSVKSLLYLRHKELLNKKGMFFPVVVYRGSTKFIDQNGTETQNLLFYFKHEYKMPYTDNAPETRNIYVDVIHENNLQTYLNDIYTPEMNYLMESIYFQEKISARRDNARIIRNPGV